MIKPGRALDHRRLDLDFAPLGNLLDRLPDIFVGEADFAQVTLYGPVLK
jgi:hypothetical protein